MRQRGLSLIELVVALVIVGIMSSYALFWSRDWAQDKEASATVASFAGIIHLARHAAIMGSVPVNLCPADVDGCGRRNAWDRGALVFVDHNGNRRIDGRDHEVKRLAAPTNGMRVYWRSFRNRSYLRFTPHGLTDWQNGNFLFCPTSGNLEHARQLVLNYAGRVYFSKDSDGDGIHEDAGGRPLVCP